MKDIEVYEFEGQNIKFIQNENGLIGTLLPVLSSPNIQSCTSRFIRIKDDNSDQGVLFGIHTVQARTCP